MDFSTVAAQYKCVCSSSGNEVLAVTDGRASAPIFLLLPDDSQPEGFVLFDFLWHWGLNAGSCVYKASALPLSYILGPWLQVLFF